MNNEVRWTGMQYSCRAELRYMSIGLDVEESITMVSYECSNLVDCCIVVHAFIARNDFT